jgi:hypothetical protein
MKNLRIFESLSAHESAQHESHTISFSPGLKIMYCFFVCVYSWQDGCRSDWLIVSSLEDISCWPFNFLAHVLFAISAF